MVQARKDQIGERVRGHGMKRTYVGGRELANTSSECISIVG
jgi:hypothetical protein